MRGSESLILRQRLMVTAAAHPNRKLFARVSTATCIAAKDSLTPLLAIGASGVLNHFEMKKLLTSQSWMQAKQVGGRMRRLRARP